MNRNPPEDVVDPVCGMTVNPLTAPAETTLDGRTYFFCAPICRERFEEDPGKYLSPDSD
jgi:Cu+-exporting ATPase